MIKIFTWGMKTSPSLITSLPSILKKRMYNADFQKQQQDCQKPIPIILDNNNPHSFTNPERPEDRHPKTPNPNWQRKSKSGISSSCPCQPGQKVVISFPFLSTSKPKTPIHSVLSNRNSPPSKINTRNQYPSTSLIRAHSTA